MDPKLVVAFLVGCASGGFVVHEIGNGSARETFSTPNQVDATSTASPPPTSTRDPANSSRAHRISAAPVPRVAVGADQHVPGEPPRVDSKRGAYDFSEVTNSEKKLEQIFQSERTDAAWSSQTVDSLNLLLSQMPERAVIGEYGLTCKESLCKLEIRGPNEVLASARPEINPQPALIRLFAEPPGSEIFDDSTMRIDADKNDQARITIYAHRRPVK
jgi:hypothetical protein